MIEFLVIFNTLWQEGLKWNKGEWEGQPRKGEKETGPIIPRRIRSQNIIKSTSHLLLIALPAKSSQSDQIKQQILSKLNYQLSSRPQTTFAEEHGYGEFQKQGKLY
jgi:hypothetical protein